MNRLNIGLITTESANSRGLAAAAQNNTNIMVHRVNIGEHLSGSLDGLIIDVPLEQRCEAVTSLAPHHQIPMLVEMPLASSSGAITTALTHLDGGSLFSLNPLDYHYPTRRLREEIEETDDPLEALFAAWRFQDNVPWAHALPQLVDFIGKLCGAGPIRMNTITREDPKIVLGLLRYENGIVGNLEVGTHLPDTETITSDLLIECFCRDSVYQCSSDKQAITVSGRRREHMDWSPDPAGLMVSTFVDELRGHHTLARTAHEDLDVLAVSEQLLTAPRRASNDRERKD